MNRDDVLNEAVDPEAAVMVDIDLPYFFNNHGAEHAVMNLLYHWYLKTRSHVYLQVQRCTLRLDDGGWQKALEWGLFRECERQSHFVALDDTDTLKKCLALRWMSVYGSQPLAGSNAMWLLAEEDLKGLGHQYSHDRICK